VTRHNPSSRKLHIAFWWWALRIKVCDLIPGPLHRWSCYIHGFRVPPLPDDDPCWERAGWEKSNAT
jgi:hypothetical protein